VTTTRFTTKALTFETWPDFAALAEAHNGVWNGCWCLAFHDWDGGNVSHAANRAEKERRVRDDEAHAALVYAGDACVGWAQFGPPEELPRIKNRKAYERSFDRLPDWRITCFFVGKGHRRTGVAHAALAGALAEIANLGGGLVEGYPEDLATGKTPSSFLWSGAMSMFERQGFERVHPIGKHQWVVRRRVRRRARR
jgi:GNAT superfamily N-acetyltransferase